MKVIFYRPTARSEAYGSGICTHSCGTCGRRAAGGSSTRGEHREQGGWWGARE